jgi:hypothetical protein
MNNRQVVRLIQMLLRKKGSKNSKLIIGGIVLLVGYAFVQPILEKRGIALPKLPEMEQQANRSGHSGGGGQATDATSEGEQAILDAFAARQSDLIVQCTFTIKKNLPDDNVGSRHQKMILLLPSGHSVLLAHNIDLADRVPADEGDTLEIKGEYEYSEQGGVLHWTHHDPRGRHVDGWIKHDGVMYE